MGSILDSMDSILIIAVFMFVIMMNIVGVGVVFLIIGLAKRNRRNAAARAEAVRKPAYTPWPAPQPVPQPIPQAAPQPVPQPVPQPAPQAAPQYVPHPVPQPTPQAAPGGAVGLDWEKYAPLEAGVSYNPNKDYKFHRAEGFVGSVPQTFVNRTFPKCPICCTKEPYWTIAQHNQMSWKGNLYLFKCSHCESIISMSMPDVTTLGNGGGGFAASPTVGLTNLMVKSSSGKEAGAVYAVIESVGRSGIDPRCQGKEFKLEHLQDMFDRN